MLHRQAAITVEAFDALVAWSGGDPRLAWRWRPRALRRDQAQLALRVVLATLDAEDLYTLSADLDEVLNAAKDLTRG